jgi:hypothetical protein
VIWQTMGGAAAGYNSLVGVLVDNFEALSGKDITCLAAGTKLRLCRQQLQRGGWQAYLIL